jgi:8-oxo-dGTP diphosphatase
MIEVVAGIIRKDNRVLIARRATHKKYSGKWEFPGGKIKKDEDHFKALERELFEEFGIITETKEYFCVNEHDYGTFKIRLIAYITEHISGNFNLTDHDTIEWVPVEELNNYGIAEADLPIVKKLQML